MGAGAQGGLCGRGAAGDNSACAAKPSRLEARALPIEGGVMTRAALALAAFVVASSNGLAETMLHTPDLACRAVADVVSSRGAVLLATGGDDFDRYVSDQSRCALGEQIAPAWVRSADNASCFIGYTCDQYHE
jgi:hypothetical protein